MAGDVLAHHITSLVEALEAFGGDVDRALAMASLTRADIANPNARLSDTVEQDLWDAAVEVTGDPQIGLRLAPLIRHGTLGAYEYLLRNAGTLGTTIDWADRYMRVVDTRTRIGVREEGDLAVTRIWRHDRSLFPPEGIECLFGVIAQLGRDHIPPEHGLRRVTLVHDPIGDLATYEETFGCPVQFGAVAYELWIGLEALQCPLRGADPGLGEVLREHVQGLLDSAPPADPIVENTRRLVSQRLAQGSFALEDLAKALHLSPRTLRRRLEGADTSYSVLLDDVRREQAAHLVGRTDEGLAHVATALGYADASTFYRAFKRWTALTPAQYRKQARGQA